MKKHIPLRTKLALKYAITSSKEIDIDLPENKCIFLFLAADYGNLGDIAITHAQVDFLKNTAPSYHIIEIPISETIVAVKHLQHRIRTYDIITLIGGGNMGDMYDDIEWLRQLIIKKFPLNRIISFPQTIDFSTTTFGHKRFKTFVKIYQEHKRLKLLFREESSYNKCIQYLPSVPANLVPDIVMTLDMFDSNCLRDGVLVCLRNDKESSLHDFEKDALLHKLEVDFGKINYSDTHVGNVRITESERLKYLNELWGQFGKHRLVVTDRLHGMIFAFITGTPAIVFDNSNKKISGCYKWIEQCGYIKMIHSVDDINLYPPIPTIKEFSDTHTHILNQFNQHYDKQ